MKIIYIDTPNRLLFITFLYETTHHIKLFDKNQANFTTSHDRIHNHGSVQHHTHDHGPVLDRTHDHHNWQPPGRHS